MPKSLKDLRGWNQPTGCVKAISMPIDQYLRSLTRGISNDGAFKGALHSYCQEYFDRCGIEDWAYRHQICDQFRSGLAFPTLLSIWIDSEAFRSAYSQELGAKPPRIRERAQEPRSTFFAKFVREFWFDTYKEAVYGNADSAHNQRVKKVAKAAKEVDLVEYFYVSRIDVRYFAKPALHSFFTEFLPQKMDIK
ncbi:hypothetical protein [uncultured Tateyamaria sp.]|uniref:hypothetical protein n=1 Tax=uncultured Tateyamaria sp. TaxID=455651 RepID=UPI002616C07A|nr:hypothetical protein [uncultured Tateyamaria sp.]